MDRTRENAFLSLVDIDRETSLHGKKIPKTWLVHGNEHSMHISNIQLIRLCFSMESTKITNNEKIKQIPTATEGRGKVNEQTAKLIRTKEGIGRNV